MSNHANIFGKNSVQFRNHWGPIYPGEKVYTSDQIMSVLKGEVDVEELEPLPPSVDDLFGFLRGEKLQSTGPTIETSKE